MLLFYWISLVAATFQSAINAVENAAFDVEYILGLKGNESYQGHRAVGFSKSDNQHFIYDVFSGEKIRPVNRGEAQSSIPTPESVNRLTIHIFLKQCLNVELGNPDSGMCDSSGCGFANSSSCNESYFDCCTQKLQDTNGRWECAWAVCKKTTLLLTDYENGGCCANGNR